VFSIKSKIKQPGFLAIMDQVVSSGSSFVLTILLAHSLSIAQFGAYSAVLLLSYLFVSISNSLVVQPFQTLQASNNSESYLAFSFWLQIIVIGILLLILLSFCKTNASIVQPITRSGKWAFHFILFFSLHDYLRKLFLGISRVKTALLIDVIAACLQLIGISLAYLLDHKLSDELFPLLSLTYLPSLIIALFALKPFQYSIKWLSYILMHIHEGKWLLYTALIQWWSSNLFVVVSGLILGLEALGAFRLVQSLFGIFNLLLQSLENYAIPEATRQLLISREHARSYIKQIITAARWPIILITLLLLLFPKYIMRAAGGSNFEEYSYVVQGMTILYLLIFIGYPIRMSIRVLALNKSIFIASLLAFLFSAIAASFLLTQFALAGVIAGLIISQLIALIYWQYTLMQHKFHIWK
jgi:O-antigen/teichoic acid export membrane protein